MRRVLRTMLLAAGNIAHSNHMLFLQLFFVYLSFVSARVITSLGCSSDAGPRVGCTRLFKFALDHRKVHMREVLRAKCVMN